MALPGVNFLIVKMQQVGDSWTAANKEVSAARPLTIRGRYTLAQYLEDQAAALKAINGIPGLATTARLATAQELNCKAAAKARLFQFRHEVLAQVPDSTYATLLPTQPHINSSESNVIEPLEKMNQLWQALDADDTIEDFVGPLTLQGGYTQQQFSDDVETLRQAFMEGRKADNALSLARVERDRLLVALYARMKQYLATARAQLPPDSAVLTRLPRLSPPRANKPPAATVTVGWDAEKVKAVFTINTPPSKKIKEISVRLVSGPSWVDGHEVTIAELSPRDTVFETDIGLEAPGAMANYKFVTVAPDGSENGGTVLKITRPA